MKIFLAASESNCILDYIESHPSMTVYNHLFSYYYTRNKSVLERYIKLNKRFNNILIDSGAHTFHTAKNIDFKAYTEEYASFIRATDKPNVVGYFEMDIDNRIGYNRVKKLRSILEDSTDKIIPVWHKNRGFNNFERMCEEYNYVSISCLPIEGIPTKDLKVFVDVAHENNCRIHGLGGTRMNILDSIPFDSVDSASWLFSSVYGRFRGRKLARNSISDCERLLLSFFDWRENTVISYFT